MAIVKPRILFLDIETKPATVYTFGIRDQHIGYKQIKEDGEAKFFAKMTNDRAKEMGLNGVYLVLCKKPKYLRIHMDPETQKKLFTASNRTATVGKIVARFKEDEFDAGLLDGLKEIESILETNSKETTKNNPKGDK